MDDAGGGENPGPLTFRVILVTFTAIEEGPELAATCNQGFDLHIDYLYF